MLRSLRTHAFPLGCTLVILCCTAFVLRREGPAAPAALLPDGAGRAAGAPLSVVAVFQARDCDSNLQVLQLFRRPELRRGFRAYAVLLPTGAEDGAAMVRFREQFPEVPIRIGTSAELRSLTPLGYRQTPYFVVLDREARVRFGAPSPPDPESYLRLARTLGAVAQSAVIGGSR